MTNPSAAKLLATAVATMVYGTGGLLALTLAVINACALHGWQCIEHLAFAYVLFDAAKLRLRSKEPV